MDFDKITLKPFYFNPFDQLSHILFEMLWCWYDAKKNAAGFQFEYIKVWMTFYRFAWRKLH